MRFVYALLRIGSTSFLASFIALRLGVRSGIEQAMPERTSWPLVLLLFLAGVAVAFQIGKMPPALGALQDGLGLSLIISGWAMSVFSLIAALSGIVIGALAARLGPALTVLVGMGLNASAGFAGAFAQGAAFLLVTRALEGVGFLLTIVSVPPLMFAVASLRDRPVAMGVWGAYMPVGTGLMMALAGPLVDVFGWRVTWLVTAALVTVSMAAVLFAVRQLDRQGRAAQPRASLSEIMALLRQPAPLLAALVFGFYALQYLSLFGFLPLMLIQRDGLTTGMAASLTAVAVVCNAGGNMSAGFFLRAGARPVLLFVVASIAMASGAAVVFYDASGPALRFFGAALFSGVGGFIPGTLFAVAPAIVSRPQHLAGINGLVLQGAAIGQLLGPPLVAYLVASGGTWSSGISAMAGSAAVVTCGALLLNRLMKSQ